VCLAARLKTAICHLLQLLTHSLAPGLIIPAGMLLAARQLTEGMHIPSEHMSHVELQ
jgi:hypothetical protein